MAGLRPGHPRLWCIDAGKTWMPGTGAGMTSQGELSLEKTLASKRHKALIALLIERREAAGMTQTQLADRLGQYQSFVARLESGQRRVDVVEYLELAAALGFDAGKMLAAVKKED
jgi:ribosome-binding protein aMBF1 (putative translation factor)